jgi:hypothetical protein
MHPKEGIGMHPKEISLNIEKYRTTAEGGSYNIYCWSYSWVKAQKSRHPYC